jgi:glucose-1-phosphate cytidylyltransferase
MNGGFFVFSKAIFDQIQPGEDLIDEPFARLIVQRKLCALKHAGFWSCMDTYKEMQDLEGMYADGSTPWEVWKATEPEHKPVL